MGIFQNSLMGAASTLGGVTGYTLWAWGDFSDGASGLGNNTTYSSPVQIGDLNDWTPVVTSDGGSTHAIKQDGTLWGWGEQGLGQIGDGTVTQRNSPVQVGALADWLARDADERVKVKMSQSSYTVAIKPDGTLWAWGAGEYGRMPLGSTTNFSSPVQVGSLTDWDNVAAGTNDGWAVKTDGTLWAWGRNYYGGVGQGNTTNYSSPVQVGSLTDWALVFPGGEFVHCIKTDGTLWGLGKNYEYGSLGDGTLTNRCSPVQIGSLTTWASGDGGTEYAAAVKTDGTLWSWGRNARGVLGLNNTTDYSSPVQVGSLTDWYEVSATVGANGGSGQERGTMVATKTDGTLWGWGTQTKAWSDALTGTIGVGNTTTYSSPVQVGSLTDWRNAWTTNYVTIADKTDGTLWAWGFGGQSLGNDNTTSQCSPVQVGSLTDYLGIPGGQGTDLFWHFVRSP